MRKKLNLRWVSDEIGEDYKNWKRGDVVTIEAQTGTGKTFFIKNVIIPYMESYEKILLVCNRINLKRQLKKDLFDYCNIPIPKTFKELDEVQKIGDNITIMSYQTISELRNCENYGQGELNLNEYDYIICDECHFFLSDSGFNNKCDLAFDELVRGRHRNAIKIFISATMEEIETTIIKSVENIRATAFGSYSNCKIHKYSTDIDYNYLNIKYFKDIRSIVQLIKNDKSYEKWLIFVTNKEKGNSILEDLKGICKCEFITKETKECEELKSIVNSCKFKSKVLICTKAMDNGINIQDESVKNIVIMSYDKTTFIQELGRIRFNIENAPTISLYIPTYKISTFNTLVKVYENKEKKIKEFEDNKIVFGMKYDRDFRKLPEDIFIKSKNGDFQINLLGYSRFYKDKRFIEDIQNKIKVDKFAYIKEQLKWLGQEETFDKSNLIEDIIDEDNKTELYQFLKDSYDNEILYNKEFFVETVSEIIEADDNLRVVFNKLSGNGKSRAKGAKIFNKLFSSDKVNIPYIVGSKKTTLDGIRRNYWAVLSTDD